MAKKILFIGPVALLFIVNLSGFFFDELYATEVLKAFTGEDPASLDPIYFDFSLTLFRAAALVAAAASFLSIYLFRVMLLVEEGRMIAFLGILIGGTTALGAEIAALSVLKITWLSVSMGLLFVPIAIGLLMALFAPPEST